MALWTILVAGASGWSSPLWANDAAAPAEGEAVVDAAITDRGAVMDGQRRRDLLTVRPFAEAWTGFVEVKNTGTAPIDRFRISFSCPMEDSKAMRVDLVSPNVPSWLWKPLVGDMLSLCTRDMDIVIQEGRVEMKDTVTGLPITVAAVYPSRPLGPEGLAPGETVLIEYTELYRNCLEGFVQSIGVRKKLDVTTRIVDSQNGVMHMMIANYKMGFLTFDQVIAELIFKGTGETGSCALELSIDGKIHDSVPWVAYEWR